ncbi:hypothetical protein ACJMK2_024805 [Sinanodonta woodiana]|uniref:CEP152 CEP63 binding coiled coil domain-containing protein n=1 Tax=Sinanodonta woodiana TaxID=1069815 RepID=A0ABD3XI76_SINWO
MSNLSLMNPGTSLNFDGQALQNAQEDEYRKEEEQQQNELRQLLTNAFDDLMDEDDILSVTSEEGGDSRNVSLSQAREDSILQLMPEIRESVSEQAAENDWIRSVFKGGASTPMLGMQAPPIISPSFSNGKPLSRTQDFQRVSVPDFQQSLRQSQDYEFDIHSNPSVRASREQLDSDYGSNQDFESNTNIYHVTNHHGNTRHQYRDSGTIQEQHLKEDRDSTLQRSIEQLDEDGKIEYNNQHMHHGNAERENEERKLTYDGQFHNTEHSYPAVGHHPIMWHHHVPYAAEQPYDTGIHGSHGYSNQGQQEYYHYNSHQNQYMGHERRPQVNINGREETEGGNVEQQNIFDQQHHYHIHHGNMGVFKDTMQHPQVRGDNYGYHMGMYPSAAYAHHTDQGFYTNPSVAETQTVQSHTTSIGYNAPSQQEAAPQQTNSLVKKQQTDFADGYKVKYKKGSREILGSDEPEQPTEKTKENNPPKDVEAEFFQQGDGSGEGQQLAQLQILYKARGRKVEELTRDMEDLKQATAREIRILKHQLSVAKGEKEGLETSLKNSQGLLSESNSDNAQYVGKLNAAEAQLEGLKKGKEELIKKLQTAETTIENLTHQLEELGNSETLTRARHEHDSIISGLQQKYEKEIKILKEKCDKLNQERQEKDSEINTFKQKLASAVKAAEEAQISRADTINRLTQSLEESQKRCRNLLESSASQEVSQLKNQLQQARASKSISEEICQSLQDEIKDLKEQLSMFESASSLGVLSQGQTTHGGAAHDDSLLDLGIKKTLDFDSSYSSKGMTPKTTTLTSSSDDVVSNLKSELERCLVSNRQKRQEVMEMRDELRATRKEVTELKGRCERAEKTVEEQKRRIQELEECMRPGDKVNVIENRLKKDIDNLKREKQILLEDLEEMKKRIEEVAASEERLTEINQELNKQISDMVKEYDQDKRVAIERVQRACEQVSETSREQLRQELTLEFDVERSRIINRYENECSKLRQELESAEEELMKVKEEYVKVCEEKDNIRTQLEEEMGQKLNKIRTELEETKVREVELARQEALKEDEVLKAKVRIELKKEMDEEMKKMLDAKVAMSKVLWLEEHKSTKEQAIENAVKLAEAELRMKLDVEMEAKSEKRLNEAKLEWQAESSQLLEEEQKKWEKNKSEEFARMLTDEKLKWRMSELQQEVDKERKKWLQSTRKDLDEQINSTLDQERKIMDAEFEEKLTNIKATLEAESKSQLQLQIAKEEEKLKQKMEKEMKEHVELEKKAVSERLLKEFSNHFAKEKETLKKNFENEMRSKLGAEEATWKELLEKETKEREREKDQWKAKVEDDWQKKLELEKKKWRIDAEDSARKTLQLQRDNWRKEFEAEFRQRLEAEKQRWSSMAAAEFESKMEREKDKEFHQKLETEKQRWMETLEAEFNSRKMHEKEKEFIQRLEDEKVKWMATSESELESRLYHEKEKMKTWKQMEMENKIEELSEDLRKNFEKEKEQELKFVIERTESKLRIAYEAQLAQQKAACEDEMEQRIENEMKQVLQEAREEWNREHNMEMSINTSSAVVSQSLLKEELENLKLQTEELQSELLKKEEKWMEERQELIMQKDGERKKALREVQDQHENEYRQFINEHQDTLTQALRSAREQHNKEKIELEQRFEAEIRILKQKETHLQQQLKDALNTSQDTSESLSAFEKERIVWFEEREKLCQDIAEREALLGKADQHLSKEIEKLKGEFQSAYQRRLENEMATFRQKLETEFTRNQSTEQRARLQLEKQLSEVNFELKKLKDQHYEETEKYLKEIQEIKSELNDKIETIANLETTKVKLKKEQEMTEMLKQQLEDVKDKTKKSHREVEENQIKIRKLVQNLDVIQLELQQTKEENAALVKKMESQESSLQEELAQQKQKYEETNAKLSKMDKVLHDIKTKYKVGLENLRKSFETENGVAMETMKNKMVELQKKHVEIMDAQKKKHSKEKEELARQILMQNQRSVTTTPVQTEDEDLDEEMVQELRDQYLVTVNKIKGDVMKHITETNVRAAETVKQEMLRERTSTFQQIKDFYKGNIRKIFETEVIGSNIESKLAAVEEALENLASNPNSRSTTPKSGEFLPDKSFERNNYARDAGISPRSPKRVTLVLDDREKMGREATQLVSERGRSLMQTPEKDRSRSVSTGRTRDKTRERFDDRSKFSDPRFNEGKKSSRVIISTKDIHAGKYAQLAEKESESVAVPKAANVGFRATSVTSHVESKNISSPVYRPVSVPDLSCDENDTRLRDNFSWMSSADPQLSDRYKYTSLKESLKEPIGTNLKRSNSKSETDLHVLEDFALSQYDNTASDTSKGSPFPDRSRLHDAGESPMTTPRKFRPKSCLDFTRDGQDMTSNESTDHTSHHLSSSRQFSTPTFSKQNLPLIQFGKLRTLNTITNKAGIDSDKTGKLGVSEKARTYKPLSLSTRIQMDL